MLRSRPLILEYDGKRIDPRRQNQNNENNPMQPPSAGPQLGAPLASQSVLHPQIDPTIEVEIEKMSKGEMQAIIDNFKVYFIIFVI